MNGPLFFGAAEKAVKILHRVDHRVKVLIIDMSDVPMMDMTGIVAFESLLDNLLHDKIKVVITHLQPRLLQKLAKAGIVEQPEQLRFSEDLTAGVAQAKSWL
jgi:SulP family sulfate permease